MSHPLNIASAPASTLVPASAPALAFAITALIGTILTTPSSAGAETNDSNQATYHFDWEDAIDSDTTIAQYNELMTRARNYVLRSSEARYSREGRDDGFRAADLYARAAALRPDQAEPHYLAAEVLQAWGADMFVKRTHQAIAHYSEFIRLAPKDPRLPDALFGRSILLTKLGGDDNIKKALADYDIRLRLLNHLSIEAGERESIALILSNSAELHMYIGELDRAIGLYYDSLKFARGDSTILYSYGLAVALDRDHQGTVARQIMKEAFRRDKLAQLSKSSVFFIPPGDVNYYRALGFEAAGLHQKAIVYYKRFLRVLPKSRYVERARQNLATLEGQPTRNAGNR